MKIQTPNIVLMIKPVSFNSNEQALKSNFFSTSLQLSPKNIQEQALKEFNDLKKAIESIGIRVLVLEDTLIPSKPDAIFSNHWISFHENGLVGVYPMQSSVRRLERRDDVFDLIDKEIGDVVNDVIDYTDAELNEVYLEGSGSIVLDRQNKIAYCSQSCRSNEDLFIEFCEDFDYDPVFFKANQNINGSVKPVYHTSLLLFIGTKFAILCSDVINDKKEKKNIIQHLKKSNKEILFISEAQMKSFSANVLEFNTKNGLVLFMSKTSLLSLSEDQIKFLNNYVKIEEVCLGTIEAVGGASVRSLVTDVFW